MTVPTVVMMAKGNRSSLCVKDALAKKFFGVGRDSLAARSHLKSTGWLARLLERKR